MTRFAPTRERNGDSADRAIRLVLILAAIAPFVRTLLYGFVYDDSVILLHNPVIVGWRSIIEVWKHPYWSMGGPEAAGLYRPVLMTIFAIVWNGLSKFPIAFHALALALHATATLLLATILRRDFGRWPAAAAALWFAVSPVHVEAIASIANTSEVMVAIWTMLLALLLAPRDARDGLEPPGFGRTIVAVLLYAAAIFTKESGAVAPALALLIAIGWRREGPPQLRAVIERYRGWLRMLGLWACVVVGVVIVRRLATGALAGSGTLAVPGLAELSGAQRIIAMLSTGGHVLRLLFWPTMQSPDYGPSELAIGMPRTLAAAATGLTIVWLLIWSSRRAFQSTSPDARPLVGLLWVLIAYFPASNLVAATGPILAERTLYVSSIGVAMCVAWSLEQIGNSLVGFRASLSGSARLQSRVPIVVLSVVWIALCVRGYIQATRYTSVWRSHHALFERMAEADSLNYRAYQLLALEAKDEHRSSESAQLYLRSYSLRPSDPLVLQDYGDYLLETGHPMHALAMAQRLMSHPEARSNTRAVTLLLNATSRALGPDSVLVAATRLNNEAPSARAALFVGLALDAKGDSAAALAAYRAGLARAPSDSALAAHADRKAAR